MENIREQITAQDGRTLQAVKWGARFFLAISTITSVYFLAQALEIHSYSWWAQAVLWVGVIVFQVVLDFLLVGAMLATGMRNVAYMVVDRQRLRGIVQVVSGLMLALGLACAWFSAYTSLKGSVIAGSALAGHFDAAKALEPINEQRSAKEQALAPLRGRVDSLVALKEQAIAAAAGANLMRLRAQGNAWAKGQVDSLSRGVAKQYDKRIAEAEAALAKAENTELKLYDNTTSIIAQDLSFKAEGHKAKVGALQTITQYAGAISIVGAIIFELIMALLLVAATTKPKKKAQTDRELVGGLSGEDGPGPRGGGGGNGNGPSPQSNKGPKNQNLHEQYHQGEIHLFDRP